MNKTNAKIWTFSVPHTDGWFLVDGFNFSIEKHVGDNVMWKEDFKSHEELMKFIHTNFPQLMPAVAV